MTRRTVWHGKPVAAKGNCSTWQASVKCVNQRWEKNSARVSSVTSDALGVHAAAVAGGVTAGTHYYLEGGSVVVPSDVLCSSGPWVDVRCARAAMHTKYSGVCYNEQFYQ
jgi:hypothetical protein